MKYCGVEKIDPINQENFSLANRVNSRKIGS